MPKLKMFAAIPRKPDISSQEFHDHWRHPHGTMGRSISILRKYIQSHQIHCGMLGPDQTQFEGVAEAWIDSVADVQYFPNEPTYASELMSDELLFIGLKNLKFLLPTEEVLVSGPDRTGPDSEGDAVWYDDDRSLGQYQDHPIDRSGRQQALVQQTRCRAWPEDQDAAPCVLPACVRGSWFDAPFPWCARVLVADAFRLLCRYRCRPCSLVGTW
jgi:hypothetical protein